MSQSKTVVPCPFCARTRSARTSSRLLGWHRSSRFCNWSASLEPISAEYLHPLLVTKRISAKGLQELTYSDVTTLDDLPLKANWRSDTTLFLNGQKTVAGTTTITFEKWAEETIGSCSYSVWVVNSRVELQGLSPIIFEQYYSASLNLVLRSIRLDPSGHPISEVRFDRFQIGWSN